MAASEIGKGLKPPRIFYGWWIVLAGLGITLVGDAFFDYGFSSFFIPWRDSFGWSRSLLGGVVGLSRLVGGLMAPIIGWLIDKYGPRRMMFLGLGIMGLGFIALSRINSLVMLYVVYIGLVAVGSRLGTFRPAQVAVANWFIRYRGRAMGIVMTGPGLGGSFVFLFALFINTFGWRAGAVLAGLSVWTLGFPLASVFRHRPEQYGLLPDGERVPREIGMAPAAGMGGWMTQEGEPSAEQEREASTPPQPTRRQRFWMRDPRPEIDLTVWQALRSQAFWMMALSDALRGGVGGIIFVHIAPFLAEELKLDYVVAISAISIFAFASIFGRLGCGFLGDYVNIRLLMAILLLLQGLGIFLVSQVNTLTQVTIYIAIVGFPFGGMVALGGVIRGYFFGRRYFGTIGGFSQFAHLPAAVAAPIWVGWLADAIPDGYRVAFKITSVLLVAAALTILLARRPRPPLAADRPPLLFQAFRRR